MLFFRHCYSCYFLCSRSNSLEQWNESEKKTKEIRVSSLRIAERKARIERGKVFRFFSSLYSCWYFYSFEAKFWSVICQLLDVLLLYGMNNRQQTTQNYIYVVIQRREREIKKRVWSRESDWEWMGKRETKTISDKWTPRSGMMC